LTWDEVDLDAGQLYVRNTVTRRKGASLAIGEAKTERSRRVVPLTSSTAQALKLHRDRQSFERQNAAELWLTENRVFCTEGSENRRPGDLLDPSAAHRELERCLAAADLPNVRTHGLRHTAASLHLKMGTPAKVVQELLGHSSIAVTMDVYSHVMPGMQEQAAEKMEALLFTPAEAQ